MSESSENIRLKALTEKFIDKTLMVSVFLGTLLYITGLFDYPKTGFRLSFITDLIILIAIILLYIKREKFNLKTKSLVIQIVLFSLFIFDTIEVGVLGKDKLFMILIPFYAFMVYPLRKVIYLYAFAVVIFLSIGFLFITGYLHPNIDWSSQNLTINTWISNLIVITIIVFTVIIIISQFRKEYTLFINKLSEQNQKIAEQEQYFREIFNLTSNGIIVYTTDGKITKVNDTVLSLYGYTREEILNIEPALLSYGDKETVRENRKKIIKKINSLKKVSIEWKAKKKDGTPFWISVDLKKVKIAGNNYILAIIKDITQQKEDTIQLKLYKNHLKELVIEKTKQLEQSNEELKITNEQLQLQKEEVLAAFKELQNMQQHIVQSEKLASLGLLSSGIAHEINNPLNFIQGGVFAVENYLQQNIETKHYQEIKPLLESIKEGVRRATNIVTSLNQYSRTDEMDKELCNIHKILDNCIIMLNQQIKGKISLKKEYTNEKYELRANEGKLHQVFINIIQNAIHAIENTGEIKIKTEVIKNQKKLIVKITDSGAGIEQHILDKIFDPFFTTKEIGKGTGLGLSISLQIINDHNGNIIFNSVKNKGTEVLVSLPIDN